MTYVFGFSQSATEKYFEWIIMYCVSYMYNERHYKQLHSTAMGSPVSVIVAEIVTTHNMKEQALATCTYTWTISLWLCYVEDTFAAVNKEIIDNFHEHVIGQIGDIQFTKEIEEYGKYCM